MMTGMQNDQMHSIRWKYRFAVIFSSSEVELSVQPETLINQFSLFCLATWLIVMDCDQKPDICERRQEDYKSNCAARHLPQSVMIHRVSHSQIAKCWHEQPAPNAHACHCVCRKKKCLKESYSWGAMKDNMVPGPALGSGGGSGPFSFGGPQHTDAGKILRIFTVRGEI